MVSVKRTLIHLFLAGTLALSVFGYTVVTQHLTDSVPQVVAGETNGSSSG